MNFGKRNQNKIEDTNWYLAKKDWLGDSKLEDLSCNSADALVFVDTSSARLLGMVEFFSK